MSRRARRQKPLRVGGAIATLASVSVALLHEDLSLVVGEQGAERMIALVAGAPGDIEGPAQQTGARVSEGPGFLDRALAQFEEFCTVSQSVRNDRRQSFFAPSKIHDQMFWRRQFGSGLCRNGMRILASPLTSTMRLLSSGFPGTTIGPNFVPFISPS